eukprot:Selendium_serpulae@DN10283_c0_g1_i1.p1
MAIWISTSGHEQDVKSPRSDGFYEDGRPMVFDLDGLIVYGDVMLRVRQMTLTEKEKRVIQNRLAEHRDAFFREKRIRDSRLREAQMRERLSRFSELQMTEFVHQNHQTRQSVDAFESEKSKIGLTTNCATRGDGWKGVKSGD